MTCSGHALPAWKTDSVKDNQPEGGLVLGPRQIMPSSPGHTPAIQKDALGVNTGVNAPTPSQVLQFFID